VTAIVDRSRQHRDTGPDQQERDLRAVAHELKTPLAIVFGYATTLMQQPDLPEESRRWFLRVIANQSQRLLGAIDRLEELTRLEGGVSLEPVDLIGSAREAAARTRQVIPGARITEPSPDVPAAFVLAAHPWLDLALEEALVACAAAVGEGGEVRIEGPLADGELVRLHLFTTPDARPQGLGVFLARRILEALGGAVEQERGRFTFVLRG
jgi:signal transduction histidine kinase